jgi:sulfur carrier protein ThiS
LPKVRAKILPENKTMTVEARTVEELLKNLGLSRETHVVLVNGEPLPESAEIREDDDVVVVRVLSGGTQVHSMW